MTTTNKRKWYWDTNEIATKKLSALFRDYTCIFQVISRDRVIEQYRCYSFDESKKDSIDVLVSMIKRTHGNHTVLIYEMKFIASD